MNSEFSKTHSEFSKTPFSQPISSFNKQKQPPELSCKKGVLKNSAKLIRKTIALESLFNKIGGY